MSDVHKSKGRQCTKQMVYKPFAYYADLHVWISTVSPFGWGWSGPGHPIAHRGLWLAALMT